MKRSPVFLAIISLVFLVTPTPTRAQVSFFNPPTYSGSSTVFVADFNGDGKLDILNDDGTLNLGNGDGTFRLGPALSTSSKHALAVADFNGDGRPDALEKGRAHCLFTWEVATARFSRESAPPEAPVLSVLPRLT